MTITSDPFTITTNCGLASNTVSRATTFTSNSQTYTIDGVNDPVFSFDEFVNSQPGCPVLSVEIWTGTSGSGQNPPTNMYPASQTTVSPQVKFYESTNTERTINFYLKANIKGGQVYYVGNQMFTLNIVCGPLSTTISETFGTVTQVQWFDKNIGA